MCLRSISGRAFVAFAGCLLGCAVWSRAQSPAHLPTGKTITPAGAHVGVGSFPANMAATPDGRYAVVTNAGFRQFLSVVSLSDGRVVSKIEVDGKRNSKREGLYYGVAMGPTQDGSTLVYASRGAEERVHVYALDSVGALTDTGRSIDNTFGIKGFSNVAAGIALSSDGSRLYVADNNTSRQTSMKGSLSIVSTRDTSATPVRVQTAGFPYAVAAVTKGPSRDQKVYVTSERDGVVDVVDPSLAKVVRQIRTGAAPAGVLLNGAQSRLFVANSGSDTVSVVDVRTDRITDTITLRPHDLRGLPGATPLGLALSPDEKRLYVALADMCAVAVVDLTRGALLGYVPTGWYPTSVLASSDGKRLLIACAKGVESRNPNSAATGPGGTWGQYIPNIIEGTVSLVDVPSGADLARMTAAVLANNRIAEAKLVAFRNPGIRYVFYIIKENRTYDQVLGDLPQGNGDASLCMFPRPVTPNHHALAERFTLMDNFYCCAEVSADGWTWSTQGMANEYATRNPMYSYSGRGHSYDFEGQNNDVPVDLLGIPDVARAAGGYIWEAAIRRGVSIRNYGFFVDAPQRPDGTQDMERGKIANVPTKKALQGVTNESFLQYDVTYADSEAWLIHNAPSPRQKRSFGANNSPSRVTEWRRDFREYEKNGKLPRFSMIRLPRDHTHGTAVGMHSPRAMVADNDYAIGQVVDAISHSRYWKQSAIFIIEDDAQNGNDHVDAHRSPAFVISPYVKRGTVDSRFYNTDSALRTMELLLGIPPLCQYDAVAAPYACFADKLVNVEPYVAILPERSIIAEVNGQTAYRAEDSARLPFAQADAVPDDLLNDILWGAVMGPDTPRPPIRKGLASSMTDTRERR